MNEIKRKAQELDDFAETIRGKVDDLVKKSDLNVGYVIVMTCHTSSDRWARETIANIDPSHIIDLLTGALKVVSLAEIAIKPPATGIH